MTSQSTSSSPSLESSVDPRWYESFFTAPINDFWNSLIPDVATQSEIEFVLRHIKVPLDAHILDAPCGSGRHSIVLAERGYAVTGIDLSTDALDRARGESAKRNLKTTFGKQDMSDLQLGPSFDSAICMGNSFGYMSHSDSLRFLQRVHSTLKQDATFILETGMAAESVLTALERDAQYDANGYVFRVNNEYDVANSRLITRSVLIKDGQEWRQSFSHAVYTCGELTRMLEQAGFSIRGRYGGIDDAPYKLGDSRLLIVATRC